ncbi:MULTISPECIES: multiheme c-type cytochrome [Desulfosediminicola]|uniref:multiheme c-type cytochrome n=1 Tax=Desulfosediminicola TaxID=2886823 RepID=UPI0010ACEC36|nr:multiheme c-type cytochrome [Desulfosediminicola ganghwensis]
MRKLINTCFVTAAALCFGFVSLGFAQEETDCVSCHAKDNPGLYQQWLNSKHGKNDIGCLDCHGAAKDDQDGFEHNGAVVATMVTPHDCGRCHEEQMEQATKSHHAKAGEILESSDAYLAHVAGGHPIAIVGCESCHGAKVIVDESLSNKLSPLTWPNSGIGRINPDGSKGSCNACHSRHSFSAAQARQPENCGKCHLGPDHPQKEIFEESKHGIAYYSFKDTMNLDNDTWIVGQDYYQAPSCSTCHMSATFSQPATHDVGDRISWTLRPPVSTKLDNWQERRTAMENVCLNCHQQTFIDGHYYQYDALVMLYNEKFAKPAGAIMKMIQEKNVLKRTASFANDIEWEYWELWHHEGRRARMGTAMMGPDYAWWHGIYDVAHNFYFKFIPEALRYNDPEITAYIQNMLENDPMHTWLIEDTKTLKGKIKSGELQKIYAPYFIEKDK